jgi:hypothetical protein
MKTQHDPWYLRLPDGRVVKAKSTSSVRHHIETGDVPLSSMARRHSYDEWVSLSWLAEFADLGGGGKRSKAPATDQSTAGNGDSNQTENQAGISARLDPLRLQAVGIRGLVDELIAAFDSAIGAGKGIFACAVLAMGTLAIYLVMRGVLVVYPDGSWLAQLITGLIGGFIGASVVALLTRQTHLELSTLRPVRLAEARQGIGPFIFRVFVGYVATMGVCIGLIVLLRHVPEWLTKGLEGTSAPVVDIVLTVVWGASLVIVAVLLTVILLSFLIPPILIVEECTVGDALREWRSLWREHRIRVVVYEGLALALALVAALPLAVPVYLAQRYLPPAAHGNWLSQAVPLMLDAIVAGPALTFLAVANLYIYFNLRYEYSPSK